MRIQQLRGREETPVRDTVNDARLDAKFAPCDMSQPHIKTPLPKTLSVEERSEAAEHAKACSACHARFQEQLQLEEDARKLPSYKISLYMRSLEKQDHLVKIGGKRRRNNKQYKKNLYLIASVFTIIEGLVALLAINGKQSTALLLEWPIVITAVLATILNATQHNNRV